MAAIDKIYGTKVQAKEFYDWCSRAKPEFLRYFYDVEYFPHLKDTDQRPITNFSEEADRWMAENCPLSWVQERLSEQYGD